MTNAISGEVFSCSSNLSAKYVGKKPYGTSYGNLKVYIPTLMPNISMGGATTQYTLNKSMFCNSTECAITPMSRVSLQTFVTAKSFYNTEFQRPHLDYGAVIEVHSDDKDFQTVYITTNKDPSTFHAG